MSDRKYRQRGYMDDQTTRPASEPRDRKPREFRAPNLPGFRDVVRCARCGEPVASAIDLESRCRRCGADLHSCAQCASFDTGARFECAKPIPARVTPKDARNHCTLFEARVTVERQTGSTGVSDTRQAFDDLFK